MDLTAENVHQVFTDCLYKEGENTDKHIKAEAIMMTVGFHPGRLKDNYKKIGNLLNQLSNDFKKDSGGGMSFLNMCEDKDGNQWTGSHKQMDELVALGIASGEMEYLIPKKMWEMLPGGMPYLVVTSIE